MEGESLSEEAHVSHKHITLIPTNWETKPKEGKPSRREKKGETPGRTTGSTQMQLVPYFFFLSFFTKRKKMILMKKKKKKQEKKAHDGPSLPDLNDGASTKARKEAKKKNKERKNKETQHTGY